MGERSWNKPIASILATTVLAAQVLGGVFAVPVLGAGKAEAAGVETVDPGTPGTINLRLMSTTDVHTNVMGWDYFKNNPSLTVGLDRTATLVKQAKAEPKGTYNLLLDNGDLIQGTPLGTYMSKQADPEGKLNQIHPMIAAMNIMGYDAATLGNHEFNYGLNYLESVTSATYATYSHSNNFPKFPYLNANVYVDDKDNNPGNDENYFTPYKILDKKVKDSNGVEQTIKVGLLGLVTPQIMDWDKANLEGKVITKDIAATASKFVPQMKAEGADIIVAMAHTGFDGSAVEGDFSENDINALSKVAGIDAITFSHTHKVFPAADVKSLDASFKDAAGNELPGIDNAKGHINGVPAVQAGYGGGYLGLIDLAISPDPAKSGHWKVDKSASTSSTRSIYRTENKVNISNVEPDPEVDAAVAANHQATIKYVNEPLGTTTVPMNSYFALVQDDPTVQIVTYAQKRYVENLINTDPSLAQYKGKAILSVGAPFKAGRNGPEEYTEIEAGPLTIRSASDLYLYDNTLKAVEVSGATVKEWVEMSAGAFNRIDPAVTTPQELLNSKFAVYNFDVIDGIKYKIDVTKNAKYNTDGTINDGSSSRVTSITYNDQPLNMDQKFIVVTNNYRASGGGNFPIKDGKLIIDTLEENRQVLMDYIKEAGTVNQPADNNWSIAPIKGDVKVTFTSSPKANKVLLKDDRISDTGTQNDRGFEIYNLDLSGDVKVHILGINDFHGQLDTTSYVGDNAVGTAAILATYLKTARAQYANSLLVHNGDSVGASAPVSSMERDKPTLEWMNLMKFDVGNLGNHEFDQGVAALKAQIYGGVDPVNKTITHAPVNFDYINANAVDKDTGKPIIKPYTVKEVGGVKIGFIGVVTKATPSKVSPAGTAGVRFLSAEEEVAAIGKYAAELQKQGVETIIVLAHDPATTKGDVTTGEAADLAKALPADSPVDVIVAGDNHALANGVVNGKLIVQAYSYGTAFEDIKLVIDPITKDVKSKSATVTSTIQKNVTPDKETQDLVNYYLKKYPVLTLPVGTTDGSVTRTDAYNNETPLGNLIADAMRQADFKDGSKDIADFAFMNPGGIRADLPKGNVSFGDLAKVQPFGNTLVKLTLTGEQIKTLLQQQWGTKADGTADTKTLQISGLKYTANMYLPVADRIASLTKTDGTPISMTQSYTAVVNNFMAAGGDNYSVLTQASESLAGPIDLDVFYEYVKNTFKGGPITAAIEGRITNNLTASTPAPGQGGGGGGGTAPTATPKPTATPAPTATATPAPAATATPAPTPTPVITFGDLGKVAWAQEAINALAAKGIIKGIDGKNFAPNKTVTRAEFVTMLVRALNLPSGASTNFSDVKQGVWYTDAIAAAVNAGIVKGSGNGKFEPGREVTREEMALMIAAALKDQLQPIDSASLLAGFGDKSKIASYAQEAVAQLTQLGIVNGVDGKKFAPKSDATRAQAAVIIYRMLEKKAS
ncbi:bifunctional 2',3'-cyclic-nucleotide 2'-phosphodiesterase/3'-nucleotidase [Paenibacillus jilunlii]|uniref:2', 3'-cyclic nucleotide 2'-phosphodiesterase n=1 Tax=Paenibacillus jilunlii TaxID=682956 RepID=A0A1G9Q300_9BACL|nr:bifunctional 2',3'-cyclic-nucleotide 2'-phosphodiesterase/3'-nucleotidase [Paenibacillus jilunlii]KWX73191.1 2', 3'-cyclic nucleotide 2'-phosphodiesterase [Paenibacillus jilunlii]SDM05422.1 2',3'-cyclic-nucleotide 2'-phosphodiesterase / 3'-nucleotidase / 5'-nucleotidase [Paenibacillus jilunlii]